MLHDIHSHTKYSYCGKDEPEVIIQKAIDSGLEVFGICDHNHGIIREDDKGYSRDDVERNVPLFVNYLEMLNNCKEKYKDQIELWRGVEINTSYDDVLPGYIDISGFDYALIECLDYDNCYLSVKGGLSDIFEYSSKLRVKCGIAHTDMFAYCEKNGFEPLEYFKKLADKGIFWELNVNYDSIHGYREHQYVKDFFANETQQEIIRKSGVELSVGFDGHRVEDYDAKRVIGACKFLEDNNINIVKLK